jgi:CDP-6-deoxy-D-xylo-4-hexulose-3-dehydrase
MKIDLPLMSNNINRQDLDTLIEFLKGEPILTQSTNVREFEKEWSNWLGVKYSVFVNSGASANLLTMAALKFLHGEGGEVIVPPLTWVSDVASVLQNGFTPVFCDVNPRNLAMNEDEILRKITPKTKAVFLTYVLGFNGVSQRLIDELNRRNVLLVEDVCESHGATYKNRKLGGLGWVSNFSFYYAHHMSTVEGGMLCTNDEKTFQTFRLLRSHGMVRESTSDELKKSYQSEFPELNPEFIFAYPAYNVRSTELNAVIGRNQLKRLDVNNKKRVRNFQIFLENLDARKYWTDFDTEGAVNYAFTLVLKDPDTQLRDKVVAALRDANVEFRRGTSGGGNQLRQPYLRKYVAADEHKKFPVTDHIHFFGFYIGNFPELPEEKIRSLCQLLNKVT